MICARLNALYAVSFGFKIDVFVVLNVVLYERVLFWGPV
jgi:hypothetical protein